MCGIAGVFLQPAEQAVREMVMTISHRDPDGQGTADIQDGSLGHVRLAILDIAGGHQPMSYEDTSIVFGSEIYNYRALKQKYLSRLDVRTHSDTEALLHLYRRYGAESVALLDGMFTFAVHCQGEFFLARDPLGIKLLYYGKSRDGRRVYFASEIKGQAWLVEQIQEFPAGTGFHSRLGWHRYYEIEETIHPFHGSEPETLPVNRSTLRKAVHKRLLADVPVGVSLSGGLDTSIVTALARQMSKYLDTIRHEYVYSVHEMVRVLPDVLYYLESFDPALFRNAVSNCFVSKLAVEYVKVMLTGKGADEGYAGYDYLARYASPGDLQDEMLRITNALHNTNLSALTACRWHSAWRLAT